MVVQHNKNLKLTWKRDSARRRKFTAINFELKVHKFSYRSKSTSTDAAPLAAVLATSLKSLFWSDPKWNIRFKLHPNGAEERKSKAMLFHSFIRDWKLMRFKSQPTLNGTPRCWNLFWNILLSLSSADLQVLRTIWDRWSDSKRAVRLFL